MCIRDRDNPLIGVSVFTENRKAGTVTDVDGHFSISAVSYTHLDVYKRQI